MLKAMTAYKASLENAKDSFDIIVATGNLVMDIIKAGVVNSIMYDEAKEFSHGDPTNFIIYLLSNTDLDMYKTIDRIVFLCKRSYFMGFEDALNKVLTFDVDTINNALLYPSGFQAQNLKVYASLMEYMNN